MGKLDLDRLLEVLKVFKGDRHKAAEYLGLSKTTVSKAVNHYHEFKDFRLQKIKNSSVIHCAESADKLYQSHLRRIMCGIEYRNASEEEKRNIEARIKKIFKDYKD